MKNDFCDLSDLKNEADVENWFVDPLLKKLGYKPKDIKLKKSISELKVGKGSKTVLYKPDYVLMIGGIPTVVIDAKAPSENIEDYEKQCSSYCLEINKLFAYNPVIYYLLSNGIKTSLYKWDSSHPVLSLNFNDFIKGNVNYTKLEDVLSKGSIITISVKLKTDLEESDFKLDKISLPDLNKKFVKLHQDIWKKDKKAPGAAFTELMKIVFVKINKDKELYATLGFPPTPKYKDVVFSTHWISSQTENESPINDPLFKNLVNSLEKDIQDGKKKRIFNKNEQVNLNSETIKKIVKEIEHIDFYGMEEDVHGRMFESFLDATVRGPDIGQFFTTRDVVNLMVKLASITVSKRKIDLVLDACCGSGGFLIAAMIDMTSKVNKFPGLTNIEKERLLDNIKNHSIYGIDGGSDPPIYRIARMNMYLHGDGGSNIYFADSLDKKMGGVGKLDIEEEKQLEELKEIIIDKEYKFDVILSNPPFSMKYSRSDANQTKILDQYDVSVDRKGGKILKSLLSSVMFIERYKDLVTDDGRILAIIDESILSGQSYGHIREYIRDNFIIKGIISLPGDAFRRASARVKTSILILKKKAPGETQSDVFLASTVYLGLEEKIAKRIGIKKILPLEKEKENKYISEQYANFEKGISGPCVFSFSSIKDRLDVKYCLNDRGRKKSYWKKNGYVLTTIGKELRPAKGRSVKVEPHNIYNFLRVNYDGEIIDGDIVNGEDCSYNKLYFLKSWDILLSNMGVGRGAVGIVPPYHSGKYVSNEYTILEAKSKEEAAFYSNLLRTEEILGDILSTNTGMNRGRISWDDVANVEVPVYVKGNKEIQQLVRELEEYWKAHKIFIESKNRHMEKIGIDFAVSGEDAHERWLKFKPPE